MEGITDFLNLLEREGYEMVTLNKLGAELEVMDLIKAKNTVKKIGIKGILDTYFEEVIFESNTGEVYELIVL